MTKNSLALQPHGITMLAQQPNELLGFDTLRRVIVSRRKKAYCAKHPKEGRCNAESITVANTYMRTVTDSRKKSVK